MADEEKTTPDEKPDPKVTALEKELEKVRAHNQSLLDQSKKANEKAAAKAAALEQRLSKLGELLGADGNADPDKVRAEREKQAKESADQERAARERAAKIERAVIVKLAKAPKATELSEDVIEMIAERATRKLTLDDEGAIQGLDDFLGDMMKVFSGGAAGAAGGAGERKAAAIEKPKPGEPGKFDNVKKPADLMSMGLGAQAEFAKLHPERYESLRAQMQGGSPTFSRPLVSASR